MTLEDANKLILNYMKDTYKELQDDSYDDLLKLDIAEAIVSWQARTPLLKDPYNISYFDGKEWSIVKNLISNVDGYRLWFTLTKNGKKENNAKCETYYHLGKSSEVLIGRHEVEEEREYPVGYYFKK